MKNIIISFISILSALLLCTSCSAQMSGDKTTTVEASEIVKRIKNGKPVNYTNVHIVGAIDLSQIANKNSTSAYINCEITFDGCVFEDDFSAFTSSNNQLIYSIFMRNISFRNCTFLKNVSFRQAQCAFRLDFEDCHMKGESDFCAVSANGASFSGTSFDGAALFVSATFNQRTTFAKAKFAQEANFQYCHFGNIVSFTDARFGGYVDLSNAYANALCDFTNANFGARVAMLNAAYIGQLKMAKCVFADNLSITQCKMLSGINLTNAQVDKIFEFSDNILGVVPNFSELHRGEQSHCDINNNRSLQQINIQ
ncbi:MAG: pentapeptide repeat-containing protein [Bacteroidales bacterium]|nr:pentapeptide repeat-containing protein [Bacteroidales bacterium]